MFIPNCSKDFDEIRHWGSFLKLNDDGDDGDNNKGKHNWA
jgi:hypothetical protein